MLRIVLSLALLLAACSARSPLAAEPSPVPSPEPTPTRNSERGSDEEALFPDFGSRPPRRARLVAREIATVQRALPRAVDTWLEDGGRRSSSLGRTVHRGALWQQRLYRYTARDERRARR